MNKNLSGQLASELSHLCHSYVSSYQPSLRDLKKHKVLKNLRKNKDIVLLKPDKGNGVVILDHSDYDLGIQNIIQDRSKFKPLSQDPTLQREGKLQRLLRKLNKKGHFEDDDYSRIYPKGSNPARIYGLPKMHKPRQQGAVPPFRPIVSSIGAYNYNLARPSTCVIY